MKKLVLILLLLSSLSSKSQTSVYHPFPESNALWNIHYLLFCIGFGNAEEYYSITMNGDTLINSQVYHKLETPYIESHISGVCQGTTGGYKGAVRQDSANKKVFIVTPSDTLEQLLFDFNMQVGDTVKGYTETAAFSPETVQSIDSVLVGSGYRKRWNINPAYSISFIEGVGSTYGLLGLSPGPIVDFPDYMVICFLQNGQTLYPDTTTSCEVILDVKSIPENNFSISISPNPFHNSAIFSIKGISKIRNAALKIYNSLDENVSTKKINGETCTIDRKDLDDGIYFYQLVNENRNEVLATGKFVIE